MPEVDRDGHITQTATEARQGERGPSMLNVLFFSVVAAAVILAGLYLMMNP